MRLDQKVRRPWDDDTIERILWEIDAALGGKDGLMTEELPRKTFEAGVIR
jgi:hypothetical protein